MNYRTLLCLLINDTPSPRSVLSVLRNLLPESPAICLVVEEIRELYVSHRPSFGDSVHSLYPAEEAQTAEDEAHFSTEIASSGLIR
jgi:hypothetical protein